MVDRSGWNGLTVCFSTLLALLLGVCALGPGSAVAYTGINSFVTEVSTSQAGGHPDIAIIAEFDDRLSKGGVPTAEEAGSCNCEDVRDLVTHMPTGFIGNPHAIPQCRLTDFSLNRCSPDSQVGVFLVREPREGAEGRISPVYNLEPHPGEAGLIGTVVPFINVLIQTRLKGRTGSDYGLDAVTSGIYHFFPFPYLDLHLWGNPADHSHDRARFPLPHVHQELCLGTVTDQVPIPTVPNYGCHPPTPSDAANVPYLENPTTCGAALSAGLDLTYYNETHVHADTPWPATTGCDQLGFNPSLTAKPTTTQADTASGLDIDLQVPQPQSPSVPSSSEIRSSRVTLPAGFALNPNAADGKVACTDAQLNFTTEEAAECPEFAKIGTDVINSSALPGPIEGGMYIGQPLPGQTFRLFLTADGFATHVKLKGVAHLDPQTGQIVNVFENLPQSPLQQFTLHFFGSERGLFATPAKCGTYPIKAEFVPWDSALPSQTSLSSFEIDSGPNGSPCPGEVRPFSPSFNAGTPDNTAGVSSPLSIQIRRNDGDQLLSHLAITLPMGLIQSLKGVARCPQSALDTLASAGYTGRAELASPACPASSQIGTVIAGAGAGSRPVHNPGKVFLAGPYKGAPVSIVVVVPALGGPYDLGNVAVRAAARVDPLTAQVKAISDPLPQIIEGVPVRTRSLLLRLERPGFNTTPTNCGPKSIDAAIGGDQGGIANLGVYYQVANCGSLPYGPRLALKFTGGVERRGHPATHAVFTAKPGEANTHLVSVTLPKGELLDNAHIGTICTKVQFAANACPAASNIGNAEVTTPLLDQPLQGAVYLRSSTHELPDLVVALKGEFEIEVVGRIDNVDGGLRTTFESVPDAPVTRFTLDLAGGKKGLLQNSTSLCGAPKKAKVKLIGQNGTTVRREIKVSAACGSGGERRNSHRGRHPKSAKAGR